MSERDEAAAVTFAVQDGWPTPNNCRRVAEALDGISPGLYGDILRAYADAEDARHAQHGPIRRVRSVEHNVWCDANGCRCGNCPCLGPPACKTTAAPTEATT